MTMVSLSIRAWEYELYANRGHKRWGNGGGVNVANYGGPRQLYEYIASKSFW